VAIGSGLIQLTANKSSAKYDGGYFSLEMVAILIFEANEYLTAMIKLLKMKYSCIE
jgi:hypothetical protein